MVSLEKVVTLPIILSEPVQVVPEQGNGILINALEGVDERHSCLHGRTLNISSPANVRLRDATLILSGQTVTFQPGEAFCVFFQGEKAMRRASFMASGPVSLHGPAAVMRIRTPDIIGLFEDALEEEDDHKDIWNGDLFFLYFFGICLVMLSVALVMMFVEHGVLKAACLAAIAMSGVYVSRILRVSTWLGRGKAMRRRIKEHTSIITDIYLPKELDQHI